MNKLWRENCEIYPSLFHKAQVNVLHLFILFVQQSKARTIYNTQQVKAGKGTVEFFGAFLIKKNDKCQIESSELSVIHLLFVIRVPIKKKSSDMLSQVMVVTNPTIPSIKV